MFPSIFISAGEASGEHYGALLLEALKAQLAQRGQTGRFFGMGGGRMAAAGLERVVRSEDMAVMGITEVIRHLPRIYREFRKLKRAIQQQPPDVAVLIDFPDIHFKLAQEFHRLGVPVIFFVSPQLWAWKKHRIELVRKFVNKMLVIFPFEEPFYRDHGVQAEFVGHPLAELPQPAISREEFAEQNGLDPAAVWIGLLPGSRPKEIRANLPEMLRAARKLAERRTKETGPVEAAQAVPHLAGLDSTDRGSNDRAAYEFLVPLAHTLDAEQRAQVAALIEKGGADLAIRLVADARAALFYARASIVASGTATVEAALMGNPFVVVYRVSPITYAIAKRVVTVPHVAMANLIASKRVASELIQNDFTASNIVKELERLLPDGPARQSMMQELAAIRAMLQPRRDALAGAGGAIERVAQVTLNEMRAASRFGAEMPVQS